MPAYPQDIYIEQGATFLLGFVLHEPVLDDAGNPVLDEAGNPTYGDPIPLAGLDFARMQIRPRATDPTIWVHATSKSLEDDSDGGERITIEAGGQTGRIDVVLTDQDTDRVIAKKGHYDLELVWTQLEGELRPFVQRVLQGPVACDLNTTRGETVGDGNAAGDGAP